MSALRFAVCSTIALALGTAGVFACATNDEGGPPAEVQPPATIPPPDAAADPDAADGGCSDDAGCVVTSDCSTVEVCATPFPVSRSIGLNAIWGSGPNDVWTVGTRGTILHGDGTTFAPIPSGTAEVFFAVWGTGKGDVWAINGSSPVHSRGFANGTAVFEPVLGSSWNPKFASMGRLWTGYSVTADGVWIGGEASSRFSDTYGNSSSLWRLGTDADAGAIWNRAAACSTSQPCTPQVRAFWGSSDATLLAVGMNGQAFRLDDADAGHWAYENPQTNADLEGIWGSGANDVWAVGQNGTIRHASGPAGTWSIVASPTTNDLHAIWGSGPNDVWAVGDAGTVLHFDGKAWARATIGLAPGDVPTRLLGVWGSGPDDVWIVGEGLLLHRTAASRRHP